MDRGKVSVVVSCYNYGRYLAYCLDSILAQSYGNLEIVLVNDGSTDDSHDVAQRYAAEPRLVYVRQENGGQAVAKNAGIRRATGDFIAFLDADDAWEPDKLERQMPLFDAPAVGVVYSRYSYIDEANRPFGHVGTNPYLQPRRGQVMADLLMDNFVSFSTTVVRRTCFEKVGLMDESYRMGIDWDLWLRMSVHYEFDYVDAPLLRYRKGHSGQMSKNKVVRQTDTMRILQSFIAGNRDRLGSRQVNRALSYTFTNYGYHYRDVAPWDSLKYYLRAVRLDPGNRAAYTGLAKWCLLPPLRAIGLRR